MDDVSTARLHAIQTRAARYRASSSSRPMWLTLIVYALLVGTDTVTSWVTFARLTAQHVPIWQGEWNPPTAPVVRLYGVPGMLIVSAICIELAWLLLPLVWRMQQGAALEDLPATQALIAPQTVACVGASSRFSSSAPPCAGSSEPRSYAPRA